MNRASSWSRTGCAECKKRHRKCDESKPQCGRCKRLGIDCHGFDIFHTVTTAPRKRRRINKRGPKVDGRSGRHHGQARDCPNSIPKDTPNVDDLGASPFSYASEPSPNDWAAASTSGDNLNGDIAVFTPNTSHLRCPWLFPDISNTQSHLLQYYAEKLCSVLVNADSADNPLREVVLPWAMTSSMLRNAVCAVSAWHMSGLRPPFDGGSLQDTAVSYYIRALSELNTVIRQMETPPAIPDNILADSVLLTSTFLCKYEIIKHGVQDWRPHLGGIRELLDYFQSRGTELTAGTLDFATSFLFYHDNIARITDVRALLLARHDNCDSFDYNYHYLIDPYMGFSARMISILRRAVDILQIDTSDRHWLARITAEFQSINAIVEDKNWFCECPPQNGNVSTEITPLLEAVANAYKNAIIVYLHSIADFIREPGTGGLSAYEHGLLCHSITVSKAEAARYCLSNISLIPDGHPCEAGLLPILFIIACEVDCLSEFETAFERILKLEANVGLGNIQLARKTLEKVKESKLSPGSQRNWRYMLRDADYDLILT